VVPQSTLEHGTQFIVCLRVVSILVREGRFHLLAVHIKTALSISIAGDPTGTAMDKERHFDIGSSIS
tara:strand:- start:236 stop:436 length:201 start_codon:yes stop_codon:yes gene_type:complete